jgi:hypothetical protein
MVKGSRADVAKSNRLCEAVRRLKLAAYGLAAGILFISNEACAQTAQDSVAFILFGLESGARSSGMEQATWENAGQGDFSLDFVEETHNTKIKMSMHFVVRKIKDCAYTVVISAPRTIRNKHLHGGMILVTVDFAKIYSIDYSDSSVRKITGLKDAVCEYLTEHNEPTILLRDQEAGSKKHCTSNDNESDQDFPTIEDAKRLLAGADPYRVDGAVDYFKGRVCPLLRFW